MVNHMVLVTILLFSWYPEALNAAQGLPQSFSKLVKKSAAGVVNIVAVKVIKTPAQGQSPFGPDDPFKDFFDRFFGDRTPRESPREPWAPVSSSTRKV